MGIQMWSYTCGLPENYLHNLTIIDYNYEINNNEFN